MRSISPAYRRLQTPRRRRLYPQFGLINNTLSAFSANYNALQVVVNQRYSKGFSVLGSYTWSKALGVNVSSGEGSNGPRNPYNYRADYGPLSLDRTHNFIVSTLWDVPFGGSRQSTMGKIDDRWLASERHRER